MSPSMRRGGEGWVLKIGKKKTKKRALGYDVALTVD